MILKNSIVYSVPVSEPREGETSIYRHPMSITGLKCLPDPETTTIQQIIERGVAKFGNKDFIGSLNRVTRTYEYKSYKDCFDLAMKIGSGLISLNLVKHVEEYLHYKLDVIGIYSSNREEWTICDMANGMFGFTMIPLYDTLGPSSIDFVLQDSNMSSCYVTAETIPSLLKVPDLKQLRTIISFDLLSEDIEKQIRQKGLSLLSLQQVIDEGVRRPSPKRTVLPSAVFTFSYTSGTTGIPKGVMVSHKNVMAQIASQQSNDFRFNETDTHFSYLPLPHIFERFVNCTCWYSGARIAFFGGDMHGFLSDLQAAQPTVFISVPRLFNKYYDQSMTLLRKKFSQTQIDQAVETKLKNIMEHHQYQNPKLDTLMFNEIRKLFGGRIRICLSSSAPISRKVLEFYKVILSCPVLEGYGQTEASGLKSISIAADPESGHVGGILPSLEMKLVDIPEMGYFSTDKNEDDFPQPRGEICTRGPNIFEGYYKQPDKTSETIDSEGWMHSGDVVCLTPHGGFKVIDRKKNLFKLSQGEYVAPEKVENIYLRSRGVAEAFIYGDSIQSYCVGIIVPNPEEIRKIADELGVPQDLSLKQLCASELITNFYLHNILEHGKKEGLFSFEQAQKIYLECDSLQIHGVITGSMKLQRHLAKNKFQSIIDKLYQTPLHKHSKAERMIPKL